MVFNKEAAERFMRRAIELSRQGMEAREGGPFGAVIVKRAPSWAKAGFNAQFIHEQFTCSPDRRTISGIQILADEARQVFDDYAAKTDHIRY
jgi:hypothetical protein